MAVFDGPGSYYGTHPQNILRGTVYEDREIPYFKNIVDQYRAMVKYNRSYSYNMMFVGPGRMSKTGRWEADYAFLLKSYKDGGFLLCNRSAPSLCPGEGWDVVQQEHQQVNTFGLLKKQPV